jgi:uncharacterized membrane protein
VIYTIVAALVGILAFVLVSKDHLTREESGDTTDEIFVHTITVAGSALAGMLFPITIVIATSFYFAKWYRARRKRLNDITRQAREPHGESPYRSEV